MVMMMVLILNFTITLFQNYTLKLIMLCFRIILDWTKFDVEPSPDCSSDYVMVAETSRDDTDREEGAGAGGGGGEAAPQFGVFEKLCGNFAENMSRY